MVGISSFWNYYLGPPLESPDMSGFLDLYLLCKQEIALHLSEIPKKGVSGPMENQTFHATSNFLFHLFHPISTIYFQVTDRSNCSHLFLFHILHLHIVHLHWLPHNWAKSSTQEDNLWFPPESMASRRYRRVLGPNRSSNPVQPLKHPISRKCWSTVQMLSC